MRGAIIVRHHHHPMKGVSTVSDLPRLSPRHRRRKNQASPAMHRLEARDVPSGPGEEAGFAPRHFDLGPSGAPLAFRYTPVDESTTYNPLQGYGWVSGSGLQAVDRGVGNTLTRDFVQASAGSFAVDVPAGAYSVTLVLGDVEQAYSNIKVSLEGAQVDSISAQAGEVRAYSYTTQVSDGQLTIELAGVPGSQGTGLFPLNSIQVRRAIQATLTYSGPVTEGTPTAQVTFSGATGGNGNYSYSFDFGGDGTFEITNSASPIAAVPASYLADGPANLRVNGRVRDTTGTFTNYTVVIPVTNVPPTPTAAAPATATSGSPVQFLASASDPSPIDTAAGFTYQWTFGDGSSASGASVNHTYAAAGTYSVTLRATDKDGGFNTTTRQVVVSQGTPTPVGSYIVTANDRIPNFGANPTVTATASGSWSNPATWSTGQVPAAGDIVSIGNGRVVTYDLVSDVPVKTVAIQSGGSLRFRTDVNTRLYVINLLVLEGGELQIGTQANPVQPHVKAEVIFPNVAINTAADPEQWGNGLIALGRVTTHGAVKDDTFIRLATEAMAGSTTINLAFPANGWRVGDRVELPDTRQMYWEISPDNAAANYQSQKELLNIAAISADGRTITLNQPLQFNHKGARDGNGVLDFMPHVANLTRNIVFRSQSASGVRGHTLFTARADVDIRYTQFSGLGRTTIEYFNNTTYDAMGNPSHIGTNQSNRYPVNFHHLVGPTSPQANGHQFTFVGNSVFCPIEPMNFRWGIALHNSSYGLIQENTLFNWAGGGIVADTGSEVYNVIERNLVTRTTQFSPWMPRADARGIGGDFAFEGSAYWFRGYTNYVRDNIASESRIGFTYFSFGEPIARVPLAQGLDPSQPGQYQNVHVMRQSILQFERNEAYGGWTNLGLTIWCMGAQANIVNPNQAESVVKDFRAWHVYEKAYYNYDTMRLTFDGLVVRGDWSLMLMGTGGALGLYAGDYQARYYKIINSDIQGVGIGFDAGVTVNTPTLIENTFFRSYIGVRVRPQYSTGGALVVQPRTINLRNDRFMHLNVPDINGWGIPKTFIAVDGTPVADSSNFLVSDVVNVYDMNGTPGDSFRVYYNESAPNFVLPVTTYYPDGNVLSLGAPTSGVTNAQAWQQFGYAFAGTILPASAATRTGIFGKVAPI